MDADPAVLVPALLQAAGISPGEEEVAVMIAALPGRAAAIESLYAVPEARYEEPGLVLRANLV
jgi:hypothetical protein